MVGTAQAGGRALGKYRIYEEIGGGANGLVYRAYDTHLQRQVAIKLLRECSDESLKRFLEEARKSSALNHPNVCTIYEAGEFDGQGYIVMEYIAGRSLREMIGAAGLPRDQLLNYASQVARGLNHAHSHSILHCDLKSSNVVISKDGTAKILDFGLARRFEESESSRDKSATRSDTIRIYGTPHYLAPELLRGEASSRRSDIWSFGVLLYEMACGLLPFRGETVFALAAAILRDPPASMSASVPGGIQSIIGRCLKKEPGQRYQNAGELCAVLEALEAIPPPQKRNYLLLARVALGLGLVLAAVYYGVQRISSSPSASIAVLPLVNDTADPSLEYLSDGIAEGVINDLSQLPKTKMMAFSSVVRYKKRDVDARTLGRDLGVNSVLFGHLKKEGDSIVVSVELVNGADNSQLWGKTYSDSLDNIVHTQDKISHDLAEKLGLRITEEQEKLLSRRYTENRVAYEEYLKGRYHWNRRPAGVAKGIEFFQRAIKEDPKYALAYSGLADSYSILAAYGYDALSPAEGMPQAKAAAMKAVALDPSLAEAHISLAYVYLMFDYDWKRAEEEFRKGIALNPGYALGHHWYAHALWALGRMKESSQELERAQQLDPLSPVFETAVGRQFYFTRHYDDAIQHYRKSLDFDPTYIPARLALALVFQEDGMPQKALDELAESTRILNSAEPGLGNTFPPVISLVGRSQALLGRTAEAQSQIVKLRTLATTRYVPPFYFAAIYIALGDRDEAFKWMDAALEQRYEAMVYLKVEPGFDSLRSDPRFQDLLRRMNLEP